MLYLVIFVSVISLVHVVFDLGNSLARHSNSSISLPSWGVFIHWTGTATSGMDHWMTGTSTSSHADHFYLAPPTHRDGTSLAKPDPLMHITHWDGTSLVKPDPHMLITHSCSHNTTKDKHDTLQNLEVIDMLPVTHTSIVMCHMIYFSSTQHGSLLALMYPKY